MYGMLALHGAFASHYPWRSLGERKKTRNQLSSRAFISWVIIRNWLHFLSKRVDTKHQRTAYRSACAAKAFVIRTSNAVGNALSRLNRRLPFSLL
jgi:hypothetical protein